MSTGVNLRLDGDRWREHLQTVAGATPGLVPVIKGNGYGYGLERLAAESATLGADTIAVGMAREVSQVRDAFRGDMVIMNPWDRNSEVAVELLGDPRVITTVSRLTDLVELAELAGPAGSAGRGDAAGPAGPAGPARLAGPADADAAGSVARPRVVVEVLTSMRRHGLAVEDLPAAAVLLDRIDFQGWTIHLPLHAEGRYVEAERLSRAALAAAPGPLWLSHLPADETASLARQLGGAGGSPVPVRLRVGTRLWLGDESTRTTTATVLDVHPVKRGDRAGYRQRVCPADGWIVVVSGGTSHGIGMEAPTSASTVRQRAVALATGSLEAAGLALSPFTINGKKRWFLEPPHMQSSLLFLPGKEVPPALGAEIPVELRLTTATVDAILTN